MTDPSVAGGLKWVKGEIAASLRRVRDQIEDVSSAESVEGIDLSKSTSELEEVRGVLLALALSGPARLVEEMQQLCESLQSSAVTSVADATEAMMLALIQLPDYLDRLDDAGRDTPLTLLPAINDLRESRSEKPWSEAEILVPSSAMTEQTVAHSHEPALSSLSLAAKRVRPHFHRYLVRWFQGDNPQEGLFGLGRLFNHLRRAFPSGRAHDLFAAAEALIEYLVDDRIDATPRTRGLFGRFDRIFKPLVHEPPSWSADAAKPLLNDILEMLAPIRPISPLVQELGLTYPEALDLGSQLAREEGDVLRDADARAGLASEVRRELGPIKEMIDLFARGQQDDPKQLASLESQLRSLADTLSVIGDSELTMRVSECAEQIGAMARSIVPADSVGLMSAAESLLAIEASLTEFELGAGKREAEPIAPGMHPRALLQATLRETKVELAKLKEVIGEHGEGAEDIDRLAQSTDMLADASGALRVVGEDAVAEVLDGLRDQVRSRLIAPRRAPSPNELALIADVISGVELFVETLADNDTYSVELLERADQALDALSKTPLPGESSAAQELAVESEPAAIDDEEAAKIEILGGDSERTAIEGIADDDEFREIFLEEAREELRAIQAQHQAWSVDTSDGQALATLRRSFHTLKGSGRLVGAQRVADYGAISEAILNRVIEGTLPITEPLLAYLEAAVEALPRLIEGESQGREVDISELLLQGEAVLGTAAHEAGDTRGSGAPTNVIQLPITPPASIDEPDQPPPEQPAPVFGLRDELSPDESLALSSFDAPDDRSELSMLGNEGLSSDSVAYDDELVEIFREEATAHVEVVNGFFGGARDRNIQPVPDAGLLRAFHTLAGSARMAGIDSIADVAVLLERLGTAVSDEGRALTAEETRLFEDAASALTERVSGLPGDEGIGALRRITPRLRAWQEQTGAADAPSEPADSDILIESISPDDSLLQDISLYHDDAALELDAIPSAQDESDAPTLKASSELLADLDETLAKASELGELQEDTDALLDRGGASIRLEELDLPAESGFESGSLGGILNADEGEQIALDDPFGGESEFEELTAISNLDEDSEVDGQSRGSDADIERLPADQAEQDQALADSLPDVDSTLFFNEDENFDDTLLALTELQEDEHERADQQSELTAPPTPPSDGPDKLDLLALEEPETGDIGDERTQNHASETDRDEPPTIDEVHAEPLADEPIDLRTEPDATEAEPQLSGDDDRDFTPSDSLEPTDLLSLASADEEVIEVEPVSVEDLEDDTPARDAPDASLGAFEITDRTLDDEFGKLPPELTALGEEVSSATELSDGPAPDEAALPASEAPRGADVPTTAVTEEFARPAPEGTDEVTEPDAKDIVAPPGLDFDQEDRAPAAPDEPKALEPRFESESDDLKEEEEDESARASLFTEASYDPKNDLEAASLLSTDDAEAKPPAESAGEADVQIPASETPAPIPTGPSPTTERALEGAIAAVSRSANISGLDSGPGLALPDDPELIGIFLEDANEILEGLDGGIHSWIQDPSDKEPLAEIKRQLHTLKGSGRLAGLAPIGDLSHALESLFAAMDEGQVNGAAAADLVERCVDAISSQVDAVQRGEAVPYADGMIKVLRQAAETGDLGAAEPSLSPSADAGEFGSVAEASAEPSESIPPSNLTKVLAAAPAPTPAVAPTPAPQMAMAGPQIRVRADLLDRMVDYAGEIGIYRARLAEQNSKLGFNLGELEQTVDRLRAQLRKLEIETEAQILHRFERQGPQEELQRSEFDPLEFDRFTSMQELSRSIVETVNDLHSLQTLIGDGQREASDLLLQQARITDDLQDGLLRTRMVPFSTQVARLERLVRQTARTLRRKAELNVTGADTELDRSILERIVAPLEHLLRNAVAHGIELPDERERAGKSPVGQINLKLVREGHDILIELSDDGSGIRLDAIRRNAIARGLLNETARPSDDELLELVLEPGFSTAEKVTQVAGRGVGLDVVSSEIKQLSGAFDLSSEPGRGATFTIRLPLTLAIIESLMVEAGGAVYAVPHTSVEAVSRIPQEDLEACMRGLKREMPFRDENYVVMPLATMLSADQAPETGERRWLPVLLTRFGEHRVALQVDNLLGSQRIVVKPVGPQLGSVRWLSGGTIMANGNIALIIDLIALVRSGALQSYRPSAQISASADAHKACIMVVDDSLTVRRVTTRLLQRQGMDVLTAKDGVEALTSLEERIPDVMLLDVEMPRMDGFELTRHIRRSPALRDIPIIMITSRAGEKHRRHAMELGVDRFLGKPYQEADLLDEIASVLMEKPR